jgi:antitoxin (DNA-binding transcriptional repressor) of toxin-antitoxin stability system
MNTTLSIEKIEQSLRQLVERLHLGETITLTGSSGKPLAVLVSLQPNPPQPGPKSDWQTQWQILAQEISQAWQSQQSAVEVLAEMRR